MHNSGSWVLGDRENILWPNSHEEFCNTFKQAFNIYHRNICTHLKTSPSAVGVRQ